MLRFHLCRRCCPLNRQQQRLDSQHPDIDPEGRLRALVRAKMLAASRMLYGMRGQVLAAVRTGVALPQCRWVGSGW